VGITGHEKLKCPVIGCGRDAKFIRYAGEEIIVPFGMKASELKRKPPFGDVGRNFEVECPVHGLKNVQQSGHHVTHIPRKTKKR
jgi:hypothetical protein